MKTLYLHTGFPKTGSSFLQTVFARNTNFMADCYDLAYIQPNSATHERAEAGRISSGNGDWMVGRIASGMGVSDAIAPYLATDHSGSLISNENLTKLTAEQHDQIRHEAMSQGFRVHAIAFTRDPFELAISGYLQNVKRGIISMPFEQWSSRFRYDHDRFAATLGTVFEKTTIADYSEHKDTLATAFFDALGFARQEIPDVPPIIVNRSISAEECDFLLKLNSQHKTKSIARVVSDHLVENYPFTGTPVTHTKKSFDAVCRSLRLDPTTEAKARDFEARSAARDQEASYLSALRIQEALCAALMESEQKHGTLTLASGISSDMDTLLLKEQTVDTLKLFKMQSRNRILRARNLCLEAIAAKKATKKRAKILVACEGLELETEHKEIINFLVRRREYQSALWAEKYAREAGYKHIISHSERAGIKAEAASRKSFLEVAKRLINR